MNSNVVFSYIFPPFTANNKPKRGDRKHPSTPWLLFEYLSAPAAHTKLLVCAHKIVLVSINYARVVV